jgi:hypothetical protein
VTQVLAALGPWHWPSLAAGVVIAFVAVYLFRRSAPAVRVLSGVVTANGNPWSEFSAKLSDAEGVLVRTRGSRGMYRILDPPQGKVTLTLSSVPSASPQKLVLACELKKPYAEIDVDLPVSIETFGLAGTGSGSDTAATIKMRVQADEVVGTRGATATLQEVSLKYHASVSPKSVTAATLKTPDHDFDTTMTTLEVSWVAGQNVPSGDYRAEISLKDIANSTARKDTTV